MITISKEPYHVREYFIDIGCNAGIYLPFKSVDDHDKYCRCSCMCYNQNLFGKIEDFLCFIHGRQEHVTAYIIFSYKWAFDSYPLKHKEERGKIFGRIWEILQEWEEKGVKIDIRERTGGYIDEKEMDGLEDWRPVKSKTKSAAKIA